MLGGEQAQRPKLHRWRDGWALCILEQKETSRKSHLDKTFVSFSKWKTAPVAFSELSSHGCGFHWRGPQEIPCYYCLDFRAKWPCGAHSQQSHFPPNCEQSLPTVIVLWTALSPQPMGSSSSSCISLAVTVPMEQLLGWGVKKGKWSYSRIKCGDPNG